MANTYIKIYLHVVFAVKNRDALIPLHQLGRVHSYIRTALRDKSQFPIRVGGTCDHVHILMAYNAKYPLPDIVRDIKSGLTVFINENRITPFHFQWQKGYYCTSYSHSHVNNVIEYIDNQNIHHRGVSIRDEMQKMLQRYDIEFKEEYLLENVE
ncbi:MAG: transposase [Muribaculaceae bacterium]|nr:transposase [Muribaculaceae bacterium]